MNSRLAFSLWFAIPAVIAVLDYTVRVSAADWSNHFFFQSMVLLSPIAYLAPLLFGILRWRHLAERLSAATQRMLAMALCAYASTIIAQVLLRYGVVGSAGYAVVWPLFVSGIPCAALTLAVYFRRQRSGQPSAIMALVSLLWALCPLAIDAMYLVQRGYRGPTPLQEMPVIGTTYDFLVHVVGYTFLVTWFVLPAVLVVSIRAVTRSKERLFSSAVALSLLAFQLQIFNWGVFMFD